MRTLAGWGAVLLAVVVGAAWWAGGRGAAAGAVFGGAVALTAQLAAVALLRPAMRGPQPAFMTRWLVGIGIRAAGLAIALLVSLGSGTALPLLAVALGFLTTLLPLLFLETKFLR